MCHLRRDGGHGVEFAGGLERVGDQVRDRPLALAHRVVERGLAAAVLGEQLDVGAASSVDATDCWPKMAAYCSGVYAHVLAAGAEALAARAGGGGTTSSWASRTPT